VKESTTSKRSRAPLQRRFPVGRNHAALRLCGTRQTYYTDIPGSMQLACQKILNPANI